MSLIRTDLRVLGFPVAFDTEVDRNVVELRNGKGQRIRITLQSFVDTFNGPLPERAEEK